GAGDVDGDRGHGAVGGGDAEHVVVGGPGGELVVGRAGGVGPRAVGADRVGGVDVGGAVMIREGWRAAAGDDGQRAARRNGGGRVGLGVVALSLHDALPIFGAGDVDGDRGHGAVGGGDAEHVVVGGPGGELVVGRAGGVGPRAVGAD